MLKLPSYVLVTPARNEEQFIESTIQSVVAQTDASAEVGHCQRRLNGRHR